MEEKDSLTTSDFEEVYTLLHIQKFQNYNNFKNEETFESIAASFKWQ